MEQFVAARVIEISIFDLITFNMSFAALSSEIIFANFKLIVNLAVRDR